MNEQNECADCRYYDECDRPERPIKCMGYEEAAVEKRMISEAIPTEQKKCAYEPEKICTTKCKYYRTCVGNPNKI